jgi:hypothetical protein
MTSVTNKEFRVIYLSPHAQLSKCQSFNIHFSKVLWISTLLNPPKNIKTYQTKTKSQAETSTKITMFIWMCIQAECSFQLS